MPPVTPRRIRRPDRTSASPPAMGEGLLDARGLDRLEVDLALGDLLESDGKRLRAQPFDERRDEFAAPLSKLPVVRVDLPCPLGRQDDQRVTGVDLVEEIVDLRLDHENFSPSKEMEPSGSCSVGAGDCVDYSGD